MITNRNRGESKNLPPIRVKIPEYKELEKGRKKAREDITTFMRTAGLERARKLST